MDLELNTLQYMSRYTIGLPTEVPPPHDYTQHAKRIREVPRGRCYATRKTRIPIMFYSAFVAYADAVVSFLDTADQNARLQEEYEGMITDPGSSSQQRDNKIDVVTATAQLLGVPPTPEVSVKQGLGVKTVRPAVKLPERRKKKK